MARNVIRGIHWLSWDRMCKKNSSGGIGFKKLHDFNFALLGKQAWRFLTKPNFLVTRIFKFRYLEVSIGNNQSYTWQGLFVAQNSLWTCARKLIGGGNDTCVFGDPWLPDVNHFPISTVNEELVDIKVSIFY